MFIDLIKIEAIAQNWKMQTFKFWFIVKFAYLKKKKDFTIEIL